MKQYNRAREKKNYLTSVFKHTIVVLDETIRRTSKHCETEERTTGSNCNENGGGSDQSGGNISPDRNGSKQCNQHSSPKCECIVGLVSEDGGEHWIESRYKGEGYEGLRKVANSSTLKRYR